MSVRIQIRRGTSAQWAAVGASTVLQAGEPGYDTTARQMKIGDGVTVWNNLPFSSAFVNVDDLEDTVITDPQSGEVLKFDGTNWINLPEEPNVTYGISAETTSGGANLRLTGSDPSVDDVKFAGAGGITVAATDVNTITITGTPPGIGEVVQDTSPQLGGNLDLNNYNIIGDIKSSAPNTYDIGGTSNEFKDLYLTGDIKLGTSTITETANDVVITTVSGGVVSLPAGSTVGGVAIGSLSVKGTVADYTALLAIVGPAEGDCYVVQSPAPAHLWTWDSTQWVDLGEFQGPAGTDGADGVDGNTVLNGTGAPTTEGVDGDFYIDTDVYEIYGPKVAGSWGSGVSLIGADGLDGRTILNGVVNPTTEGQDGDFYINTLTSTIFGPKAGTWPTGVSLVGADGADGQGVPIGGTTGQVLIKLNNNDYATTWTTLSIPNISTTSIDALSDVDTTTSAPTDGQALVWNSGSSKWVPGTVSGGGGGGTGLGSRTAVSATTTSLSNGATGNISITGFKGYALLKIQTSQAAWVRVYTDTSSRSSDAARSQGSDPLPGSGVIAEVITTGAQTVLISPGTIGFSNEASPSTAIPCAVTNLGTTGTVTVTLTVLQLEA